MELVRAMSSLVAVASPTVFAVRDRLYGVLKPSFSMFGVVGGPIRLNWLHELQL